MQVQSNPYILISGVEIQTDDVTGPWGHAFSSLMIFCMLMG